MVSVAAQKKRTCLIVKYSLLSVISLVIVDLIVFLDWVSRFSDGPTPTGQDP